MTRAIATTDLDAYEAEERRDDAQHLAGLTPTERREFCRALYCGHFALFAAWPTLAPRRDGRLHATCPDCGTHVSRAQFPSRPMAA